MVMNKEQGNSSVTHTTSQRPSVRDRRVWLVSVASAMTNVKVTVIGDKACGKTCALTSYTKNGFPREYLPTVFDDYQVNVKVDGMPYDLGLFDTSGDDAYDRLRPMSYPLTECFLVMFSLVRTEPGAVSVKKWVDEISKHNPGTPFILVGTQVDLRITATQKQKLRDFQSFCVVTGVSTSDTSKPLFLKTRSTKNSISNRNLITKVDRSVLNVIFSFLDTKNDEDVDLCRRKRQNRKERRRRKHYLSYAENEELQVFNKYGGIQQVTWNLSGFVSTQEGEELAQKVGAVKYLECSALTQEGLKNVFDEAVRTAINPPPISKPKRTFLSWINPFSKSRK